MLPLILASCWNPFDTQHLPDRKLQPGEVVAIAGGGFGKMAGAVYFRSIDGAATLAPVYDWFDDHVKVRVPDDAVSGKVQIFGSQDPGKPILEIQAQVAQSRRLLAHLTVRLSPIVGGGMSAVRVIAIDGDGDPVAGVRVVINSGTVFVDGPEIYLTDSDGVANSSVKTNRGSYLGSIAAGNFSLFLEHPNGPIFSGYPRGAVGVVRISSVVATTTKLTVRVRLTSSDATPRAGETVVVTASQCVLAANAGQAVLATASDGSAAGTLLCPHPKAGPIAVGAFAAGTDSDLQLEVIP